MTSAPSTFPQGIFVENSVQQMDLGARVSTADGREFVYVKAGGTALVAGKLQQAPAVVANHQNIAVAAAAAIGATSVTVTLGATLATANQYAGGTMTVSDATGEGHIYTIKSHPAADSAASLVLTLDDNDAIRVALDTTSEVCLLPNLYNGVIINPTTFTNKPVGVAVKNITAAYFGFIQTKGIVAGLNADAALTVGSAISPSNATAGGFENGVIAQGFVGSALQTGVDTEYRSIYIDC